MKKKILGSLLLLFCFLTRAPQLGAVEIQNLKSSSNDPQGDYFLGSETELKPAIQSAVQDSSKLNPIELYLAANTAFRLNMLSDAGFLFYAAQIRKAFDTKRFNLAPANGNNVITYLAFLNQTIGQNINPALMSSPSDFGKAIDKISAWNPAPESNANYPKKEFGIAVIPAKDWQTLGNSLKQDFLSSFGLKMKNFLADPKNAAAFKTVQDYNFGKLPHNPENQKKYEQALQIVQKSGIQ